MKDNPNYCQHPECHNSHVAYYREYFGNYRYSGTTQYLPEPVGIEINLWPMTGARRWCRSHALMFERVSFG